MDVAMEVYAKALAEVQKVWYLPKDVYTGSEGFMNPVVPAVGAVAYLLLKPVFVQICKALGTTGKSSFFTLLVVLHNVFLMVFSAVVWKESWEVVSDAYKTRGLIPTYCDSVQGGGEMWEAGIGRLAFLFYMSKYYEFLDTVILVVKQKKVSVLQSYHHAGAVVTMFGLCYTQATAVLWFVCLNSMIHTFMYTYYAMSVCGIRLPGKSFITTCQIIQFVVGICGTIPMYFMKYYGSMPCQTDSQLLALLAVHLYVLPLIVLFVNFYIKSYSKPASKKKKV